MHSPMPGTRIMASAVCTWGLLAFHPTIGRAAEERPTGGGWVEPIQLHIVGGGNANASTVPPTGADIAAIVGATTFYSAGYTGTRAVAANIENELIWNGHETLSHVSTYLHSLAYAAPKKGAHPTAVASALAGRSTAAGGTYQQGIAHGADLWSGGFTVFDPNVGTATPLVKAMQLGVNGRRADVVNSSWSTVLYDPAAVEPLPAIMIDALVAANHQAYVCAAGNSGPRSNTLSPPGSNYNTIAVAALASPDYNTVAGFSSRGPSDYYNPVTRQTLVGVRATVDIAAPGQNLVVADYRPAAPMANGYRVIEGTSLASPIVAGGAALLVDVGYDRFGGGTAIDGRVIQSVLQTAARPTVGWDNGTRRDDQGVWRTVQSLDWAAGAGALDLDRSYHQYTDGTTDLAGTAGGDVQSVGWDFANVEKDGFVEYRINQSLSGEFRSTLNWWVDRTATFGAWGVDYQLLGAAENSFVNLDLELWRLTGGGPAGRELIGSSESLYNNTELLSLSLEEGSYALRVLWTGVNFDVLGTADEVDFGLAWWAQPAPEPASLLLWAIAGVAFSRRHRKSVTRGGL